MMVAILSEEIRLGFGFVGTILIEVAVCRWAHQVGWVIQAAWSPHPELPTAISGATGLVILAILGWLNQLAQREAHETMSRALKSKSGERQTCQFDREHHGLRLALDPELRLVAMNSAFRNAVVANGKSNT